MRYLARFLNASDPSASLRHAAFALVIGCACGWLTWDMIRGPITTEWNVAFGLLLGAVTTAKAIGKPVGAAAPSAPGDGPASGGRVGTPSTTGGTRTDGGAL